MNYKYLNNKTDNYISITANKNNEKRNFINEDNKKNNYTINDNNKINKIDFYKKSIKQELYHIRITKINMKLKNNIIFYNIFLFFVACII